MPLPDSWVERLFARLTVRYGESFRRQYDGMEPNAVKADWAMVLEGASGEQIEFALRYLPSDRPPNAMQFRDIARRAPQPTPQRLEAPPADPQRVRQELAKLHAIKADTLRGGAALTAQRLRDMRDSGVRLTEAQQAMLKACQRHVTPSSAPIDFRPIPADLCPWNRNRTKEVAG